MKLTDIEKIEIRAEAFSLMTGYPAPGKDVHSLADGISNQQRSVAFNEWMHQYYDCINAMMLAFEHILPSDK